MKRTQNKWGKRTVWSEQERSVRQTVTKLAPAVFTALFATALGFIALYTSPVPMIQDFGKMLTIGIIVSFLTGLFLLIPILYARDAFFFRKHSEPIQKKRETSPSRIDRFLNGFTRKVISLRWIILLLALATAGLGISVDLEAGAETDFENFMPQDTQALKDIHKLRDVLGTTDQVSIMVEGMDVTDAATLNWLEDTTGALDQEFPDSVVESRSLSTVLKQMNDDNMPEQSEVDDLLADMPENQKKLLVNEEETKAVISVGIKHLEAEKLKGFVRDLDAYVNSNHPSDLSVTVTGKSVLDVEMVTALTTGRYKMTLFGMGLVFLGLLLLYRHPVKAVIPLLPILFIVGWSGGIMHLLAIDYTPLTATLGALIIGIGTEFTILIMERFFEERKQASSIIEAMTTANSKIGKAIFASAFTTIGGFSALLISDFVILNNFGMMTMINLFLALFSTIVVMPAVLVSFAPLIKERTVKN